MTDNRTQSEQAERIQRLKERRAANTPSATGRRRHHPAATTRIVLAGLSVASFFGIAGSVALANSSTSAVSQPTPASAIVVNGAGATSVAPATKATAATAGTSTRVVAHTTSRGS